jgi:hypothetical protein
MTAATSTRTTPETGRDRRPRRVLPAEVRTDHLMSAAAAPLIEGRRHPSRTGAGWNAMEWLK